MTPVSWPCLEVTVLAVLSLGSPVPARPDSTLDLIEKQNKADWQQLNRVTAGMILFFKSTPLQPIVLIDRNRTHATAPTP
jgi:hypothetical protein